MPKLPRNMKRTQVIRAFKPRVAGFRKAERDGWYVRPTKKGKERWRNGKMVKWRLSSCPLAI